MLDHSRKLLLGLALPLVTLACAVQGIQAAPNPARLTRDDLKYASVLVEPFTIAPTGVKEKDPVPHLTRAQEIRVAVLVKSRLFDSVATGDATEALEPTIVVRAELVGLRFVGAGKQQWLGGLAGTSEMKVRVTLADAQTRTVLATSVIVQDAETSGGPWSFGATDRSLPAEVGTRVAEYVALGARK